MVEEITMFKTSDGKTFDTKQSAVRHQANLDTIVKLRSLLLANDGFVEAEREAIIEFFMEYPTQIGDILESRNLAIENAN